MDELPVTLDIGQNTGYVEEGNCAVVHHSGGEREGPPLCKPQTSAVMDPKAETLCQELPNFQVTCILCWTMPSIYPAS